MYFYGTSDSDGAEDVWRDHNYRYSKRAGVSRMSYYRLYRSKDDILIQHFNEIFAELLNEIKNTEGISKYQFSLLISRQKKMSVFWRQSFGQSSMKWYWNVLFSIAVIWLRKSSVRIKDWIQWRQITWSMRKQDGSVCFCFAGWSEAWRKVRRRWQRWWNRLRWT